MTTASNNSTQVLNNTANHIEPFAIYPSIILCFRTTALKWPLSCEGEDQTWSSDEVYTKCFPQNLTRTPTTASSQSLGSYTVLPPIGKPLTEKEPKMSPGHSVNATHHIHRSNSDSYVVQMEKKKQLRVTYKVGVICGLHLCPEKRVLTFLFFASSVFH